jgi:hypothetical protein
MTVLEQLNLSKQARKQPVGPQDRMREKIVAALEVQLEAAQAEIDGQPYVHKVKRWVSDETNGARVLRDVPTRFRRWWWKEGGKTFMSLRYGAEPIEIAPGRYSVEIADGKDLVPTLEKLKQAVEQGEIDQGLDKARKTRQSTRRKTKASIDLTFKSAPSSSDVTS